MDLRINDIVNLAQEVALLNQETGVMFQWLDKGALNNVGTIEELEEQASALNIFDIQRLYNAIFNDCPDNETLKHRLDVLLWNLRQNRKDLFVVERAFIDNVLNPESEINKLIITQLGKDEGKRYVFIIHYIFKLNNRIVRDIKGLIIENIESKLGIINTATATDGEQIPLPDALNRQEIRNDITMAISMGLFNHNLVWLQSKNLLALFCACLYRKYLNPNFNEKIKWKIFEEAFSIVGNKLNGEPVSNLAKGLKNAKQQPMNKRNLVERVFSESIVKEILGEN